MDADFEARLVDRCASDPGEAFKPEVIQRLVALKTEDCAAFERLRTRLKEHTNVRVTELDKLVAQKSGGNKMNDRTGKSEPLDAPIPWHEPVDGKQLLEDVVAALHRYMVLSPEQAGTVALWAIFAHAHESAEHSPILAIQSPEKRCGKTTLLEMISLVVPNSLSAANITPSAIYRTIEALRPTLLLDEGDTFLRNNNDMRGVLNSGFSRVSAFVIRLVGDDHEPRQFATWCPKVIALIGKLPDTLEDRSIVIVLRRKLAREQTHRLNRKAHDEIKQLGRKAARWVADNIDQLEGGDPSLPEQLNDRAQDCWRPLLAVADAIGGGWPGKARTAALALNCGGDDDSSASVGALLLAHIREVFEAKDISTITSSHLVSALNENENWPWGEWNNGKPISPRGVAFKLKPFGIRPRRARFANEYWRADFDDAWKRYLDDYRQEDLATNSTSSTERKNPFSYNGLGENSGFAATSTSPRGAEHDN